MPIERSGGGTGTVTSVTAGDGTITVGGTGAAPTVAQNGWSTAFDLVSSSTLTNLMSQSIPANTLGANGALHGIVEGFYLNNSAATRGLTLGIAFGGVNMWLDATGAAFFAFTATPYPFYWTFLLANEGATNAQRVSGIVQIGASLAGSIAGTGQLSGGDTVNATFTGTQTADTTNAQTLLVRAQHTANNASLELKGSVHVHVVH